MDRLNALYSAIDIVRRGGTISLSGVYGGPPTRCRCSPCLWASASQALGRRPDAAAHRPRPPRLRRLATHRLPLDLALSAHRSLQEKTDGHIKVQLKPMT